MCEHTAARFRPPEEEMACVLTGGTTGRRTRGAPLGQPWPCLFLTGTAHPPRAPWPTDSGSRPAGPPDPDSAAPAPHRHLLTCSAASLPSDQSPLSLLCGPCRPPPLPHPVHTGLQPPPMQHGPRDAPAALRSVTLGVAPLPGGLTNRTPIPGSPKASVPDRGSNAPEGPATDSGVRRGQP